MNDLVPIIDLYQLVLTLQQWESTSPHFTTPDVTSLLSDSNITEVFVSGERGREGGGEYLVIKLLKIQRLYINVLSAWNTAIVVWSKAPPVVYLGTTHASTGS